MGLLRTISEISGEGEKHVDADKLFEELRITIDCPIVADGAN